MLLGSGVCISVSYTHKYDQCGVCAALLQEESKKLRQKQRDKTKPKMGKLDIDYQVRACFTTLLARCFLHPASMPEPYTCTWYASAL